MAVKGFPIFNLILEVSVSRSFVFVCCVDQRLWRSFYSFWEMWMASICCNFCIGWKVQRTIQKTIVAATTFFASETGTNFLSCWIDRGRIANGLCN
jgi:hypothetical protein